ncbi:MAG: hypothetical protein HUK22_07610 [Thermoguttaceae bacterium]|nr:hypothetical protein [Thermoguttaceae bacterium]
MQALHPSRSAATAIALLPFLGAGYSHTEENKYRDVVFNGLEFLKYRTPKVQFGRDAREYGLGASGGGVYAQALVAVTLAEAYEMTRDESLKSYAEECFNLIAESQLDDGGWRYALRNDAMFHANIRYGGDTSVTGWFVMALASGVSAGFELRPTIIYQANDFFDSVMDKNGKTYIYWKGAKRDPSENRGVTAVATLAREYLGWKPDYPQLQGSVDQVAKWLAEDERAWKNAKTAVGKKGEKYFNGNLFIHNLYFSYYAALALHHYGGPNWKREFPKLRDFLVETQSRGGLGRGCENGRWLFYDRYMNDGGRLLNTALSILILETPYRYLPMYR